MRLEGRTALVTGGASGIGAAVCRRLHAEGASVAGARELAGPPDVLVNNAGSDEFAFFAETEPALWDRVLAVNLRGVLAVTHAVLPGMIEARRGRMGEAGEVAAAIAFLASDDASYVTGQTLGVSGGLAMV